MRSPRGAPSPGLVGLVAHARQAAISASKMRRSPGSIWNSGCHCTPRQKRYRASSIPSITPSGATASMAACGPGVAHGLVMRRIHPHRPAADDLGEQRARQHPHLMPRLVARIGLLMRQRVRHRVRNMLDQRSAQRHRQQLLAAANPQHRHVPRQRPAQQRQLRRGPALFQRHRLVPPGIAVQRRIHVEPAAGDHQRVDPVQIGFGQVGPVRQRHGQPATGRDRVRVIGTQRIPGEFGVATGLLAIERQADHGKMLEGHGRVASLALPKQARQSTQSRA